MRQEEGKKEEGKKEVESRTLPSLLKTKRHWDYNGSECYLISQTGSNEKEIGTKKLGFEELGWERIGTLSFCVSLFFPPCVRCVSAVHILWS